MSVLGQPFQSILNQDGEAWYQGDFLSETESQALFSALWKELPWKADEVVIFGKHILTSRKMVWLADGALEYRYSGLVRLPVPFPDVLLPLKARLETTLGQTFNSCLANLYHHGGEGMGWHSDNEKMLDPGAGIASVSLGAGRKFRFRHFSEGKGPEILLENGSLLWMVPPLQAHWKHQLPPMKKVVDPRINLTFRKIKVPEFTI
jgi:alkylated DNA repair dioxygenase AlkB